MLLHKWVPLLPTTWQQTLTKPKSRDQFLHLPIPKCLPALKDGQLQPLVSEIICIAHSMTASLFFVDLLVYPNSINFFFFFLHALFLFSHVHLFEIPSFSKKAENLYSFPKASLRTYLLLWPTLHLWKFMCGKWPVANQIVFPSKRSWFC
jgi:hypothetical protein